MQLKINYSSIASSVKSVYKILIEYNSNNLEENYDKEKEAINIDFTKQIIAPVNYENAIYLRVECLRRRRKDIVKAHLIESLLKQPD